jgi:hypothetical protein
MARVICILILLSAASLSWAKDRKWLDAEVASIKESEVESSEQLYKSATVNNQANAPLREAGVDKHKSKLYTYDFQVTDKHYFGTISKKPLDGLAEHAKVKIVVERGWVIVQMPDEKEKRMDFLEAK